MFNFLHPISFLLATSLLFNTRFCLSFISCWVCWLCVFIPSQGQGCQSTSNLSHLLPSINIHSFLFGFPELIRLLGWVGVFPPPSSPRNQPLLHISTFVGWLLTRSSTPYQVVTKSFIYSKLGFNYGLRESRTEMDGVPLVGLCGGIQCFHLELGQDFQGCKLRE